MRPTPKRRVFVAGREFFLGSAGLWHFLKQGEWLGAPVIVKAVTNTRTEAMLDRIAEIEAEVEELKEKKP